MITPDEFRALMASGAPYTLLDVRTEDEYNEKHIDGAILIPDYELADRAEAELPDKHATLVVYCRSGVRSAGATRRLKAMGYTDVRDLGSIIDWLYGDEGDEGDVGRRLF